MASTEYTFSRDQCPDVMRITLDAHISKASIVHIPFWARRVTVRPEGKKCRISFVEGTGDDIHADFIKLPADAPAEFTVFDGVNVANGIDKIYIANVSSVSGATAVSIMVEGAQ
tara:strand:- start:104 stop:445 length:342 start_codon:yes stop_codon:yes gene_type:complete